MSSFVLIFYKKMIIFVPGACGSFSVAPRAGCGRYHPLYGRYRAFTDAVLTDVTGPFTDAKGPSTDAPVPYDATGPLYGHSGPLYGRSGTFSVVAFPGGF